MVDDWRTVMGAMMRNVSRSRLALCILAVIGWTLAAGAVAGAAEPPEITSADVDLSETQAGGHPDVTVDFDWNTGQFGCEGRCLTTRRVKVHFPTGFIGNPHVAPKCTLAELNQGACPSDSQVGITNAGFIENIPMFNMETRPNQAGLVAFVIPFLNAPILLELSGRTDSDYGLSVVSSAIIQEPFITPSDSHFTLWGVPADSSHDGLRFFSPLEGGACASEFCGPPITGAPATVPAAPYLQNSVVCGTPLTLRVETEWYGGFEDQGEAAWPERTGCQQLSFNPSQTVKPTTTNADTASGVDADLKVPQAQSPTTPTPSQIRTNRTTLPEGFSVNPGAADGKVVCNDTETSIGTLFAAVCPEFAKVGTSELDVSALPGPIFGGIYLGEPKPGNRYRLILTADGFATHVKLAADVQLDPVTGQVTTVFEQPQSPVQRVNLHFFGSERGLLATPERCGGYETQNEFVPWNSQLTTRTAATFVEIDSGPGGSPCPAGPRPLLPVVTGGSRDTTAGAYAPFGFTLNRSDGDQNLQGVSVATPPGFAASFKGIPYCPEGAIAALSDLNPETESACPSASLIGRAVVGAGAGSHPVYSGGSAYLAGPYKGAPLSLVVVVPAVSGPYDLGDVAVRSAIYVDPLTAQATTVSDPFPQILDGVLLRLRSVLVSLDRPNFTVNPTNCRRLVTATSVRGDEGGVSNRNIHFQVANCAKLPYEPRLAIRLSGGLKRRGHPAIRAVLRTTPGEANSRRVSVTLPKGGLLDNSHIKTICTRVDFANRNCPAGSRIGSARATLRILDAPLRGAVYLRASSNKLPDMVVDLRGQVDAQLVGRIDSVRGRLRTTFQGLPDAPVESFVLNLSGGKKGLLTNSTNLCRSTQRAIVRMAGHNGRRRNGKSKLRLACGSKSSRYRRASDRHRRLHRAVRAAQ